MARRKDEGILADLFQRQIFHVRQGVAQCGDEHGFITHDGVEDHVVRHLQKRTHGKVHMARAQLRQSLGAGDVVQLQFDIGVGLAEALHVSRQHVENRGPARRHIDAPLLDIAPPRGELVGQIVDALNEGHGQLEKQFAIGRELDLGAAPLEEGDLHLPLQRLNLQRDRGLAEEHTLGGLGDTAISGGIAEAAQLLQAILLVAEFVFAHGVCSVLSTGGHFLPFGRPLLQLFNLEASNH